MLNWPRTLCRATPAALLALVCAGFAVTVSPAMARSHHGHHVVRNHYTMVHNRYAVPANPTDPSKDAALILDGETGRPLYSRNASAERHPASLTKMMTLYLLFEAMKRGDVNLQTTLPISQHAAAQRPTNLHLYAGDSISVDTAIKAIVVRSANDVAVAIAEALGGTEGHFAELMTAKARALGMRDTFYHNASGLPDNLQITTANDLATLARHLAYDFPQYFSYFATPAFNFRGTTYVTHDNLIGRYDGADGIKTGYTGASGFNLVSSVVRNNMHIIGIVMGGRTARRRDAEMMHLLDDAFAQINQNPSLVARAGVPWRQVAVAAPPVALGINVAPQAHNGEDEDAAESAPDESVASQGNLIAPPPVPMPRTAPLLAPAAPPPVAPPVQQTPIARVVPMQSAPPAAVKLAPPVRMPDSTKPSPKPIEMAATNVPAPAPKPPVVAMAAAKPTARPDSGEGDFSDAGVPTVFSGARAWAIQIGAFADTSQARDQLAAYARKSMDVLGQAARMVIPFKGVDGHTLYRARFGPFVESQAKQMCSRLTQRGQTCFAILASAR
jgi:D-alanyl-D-alanine carboxypeptidase